MTSPPNGATPTMQANEPAGAARWHVVWPIFLGACLLQLPLILNPGYFAADEMQWWMRADVARLSEVPWLDWFNGDVLQYRPLTFNLWLLLAWLFAGTPMLMHAVFAGIGAINACLLGTALLGMGVSRRIAIATGMIFVLTPYVAYTHGWTATLADLLVGMCALLGLLALHGIASGRRYTRIVALAIGMALVLVALAAKESALALPVLFAAAAWHRPDGRPRSCALFVVVASVPVVAYLFWRWPMLAHAGDADAAYGWSSGNVPGRLAEYLLYPYLLPLFEVAPTLEKSVPRLAAAAALLTAFLFSLAAANRRVPWTWLLLQIGLLAPVLVLGIAYNHYAYLATLAAVGVPAMAWSRLPAFSRGIVWLAAFVVCAHGAQVMLKMRTIGVAEHQFHGELAEAVRDAGNDPLRVTVADRADTWMLARFLDHVPGYRGISFANVVRVEPDAAPTHRMDGEGRLHAVGRAAYGADR
ncbi:MAG: hypothetical protein J0L88_11100 [Xanthomonadales bacterium]|nr:hypothetical protein [Xanthomonadales bacterium]